MERRPRQWQASGGGNSRLPHFPSLHGSRQSRAVPISHCLPFLSLDAEAQSRAVPNSRLPQTRAQWFATISSGRADLHRIIYGTRTLGAGAHSTLRSDRSSGSCGETKGNSSPHAQSTLSGPLRGRGREAAGLAPQRV